MPLRVLLDATAVPADRGGVGRYLDDLVPHLPATGIELVVAAQPRDVEIFRQLAPDARVVAVPARAAHPAVRLVWEQVGLPLLARRVHADVLHSPHYTMPLLSPVPVVVTLHDATFFSHPELHSRLKARFFRLATRVAVRRAAGVVVPSEATAREVERYTRREVAFTVAHHGVDTERFHPVPDDERRRVAASLGVQGPYVAFLGTLEPRKNVPALVRAWTSAVLGTAHPPALVLAGGPGWDTEVGPTVDAVPDGLQVLRPGYLPLADLSGFLSGAEVVAYPSLGEGFGLPVLEAMACGAAVLTTRELSLPEVGGDAVAYCGTDEADIAAELRDLLADPDRRTALSVRAQRRAQTFTWAASAVSHAEAYRAAADRGGRRPRP